MIREEMSLQDAIQVLKDTNCYGTMDIAKSVILKALEQEPRTGRWIMTRDYLTTAYSSIEYVRCSCCGEDSLEEGNYCPNCGAKMEEVEND